LKNIFRFLVMIIIAALLEVTPSAAQTGAVLSTISTGKDGNRLAVQIKIDGTYTFESSLLQGPPRFIVDITPISRILASSYTKIDDVGVIDIRAGLSKPDTARIVFDLSQNVPAYSIVLSTEGVNVSFWYEGEVPPLEAPDREEAVKPAPPVETPREPRVPGLSNYFVSARAGLSLFLSSDFAARKDFALYGETGTLDEAYSFKTAPSFELQFGKYFGRTKIGVGVASWSIKEPGIFTAALPHPFLADAFRTVTFEASDMKYPAWNFSAFALFSILEMDKISLSGGPMLGLTTGQIRSLDDFSFAEKSPFAATDVTISNLTYIEQKFTELLFGGLLSLEYRAMPQLSVLFDLRMIYLNPKNVALGQRINFLHFQPVLGIQYNF
jgi:hypothetical protein